MPGMWGTSINSRKSTVVNQQLFLSNKVAEANDIKVDPVTGAASNNATAFFEKSNVVFENLLTTPETIVNGNLFVGGLVQPGSTGYTLDVSGSINAQEIYVNGIPVGSGSGNIDLSPITNRLTVLETSANKVDISLGAHNTRIGTSETKLTNVSYNSGTGVTTLSGAVNFSNAAPSSSVEPTLAVHLATKNYVDSVAGATLLNTDNSWNGLNNFSKMTVASDASFNSGVYIAGNVTIDASKTLNVGQINATNLVVTGTSTSVNSDDLKVKDKTVTLNVGGGAVVGTYGGSGIEVEGNTGTGSTIVANIFVDNDGEWALTNVGSVVDKILTRNAFSSIADLSLNGNLSVGEKLSIVGDMSLNSNLVVGKDVSFNSRLRVVGDVSLNAEVGILGNAAVSKVLTVTQKIVGLADASLNTGLSVGGNVAILGNAAVSKVLTVTQKIVGLADASLNTGLSVGGDAALLGNAAVSKVLTVTQKIVGLADASLNTGLSVGGDAALLGNAAVSKVLTVTQKIVGLADASLNTGLSVGGDAALLGNAAVSKGLTVTQKIVGLADASLNTGLSVGGDAALLGNAAVSKVLTVTQKIVGLADASLNTGLSVGGDAALLGNAAVSKVLTVTQKIVGLADASLNTGLSVGGNAALLGNAAVSKVLTVGQTLVGLADASLNTGLSVGGNASILGNAAVSKVLTVTQKIVGLADASLNTGLSVGGDAALLGNAAVSKVLTVGQTLVALADASLNTGLSVGGNAALLGNAAVSKVLTVGQSLVALGDISLNGNLVIAGNTDFKTLPTTQISADDVSAAPVNVFTTKAYVTTEISRVLSSSGGANLAANNVFTGLNTFTQDVSLNSKLFVGGDVSMNREAAVLGNLAVSKALTVGQRLVTVGDASLNANLVVGGDVSFNGRMRAVGDVSLNAEVGIIGNLSVAKGITVSQKLVALSDASLNANLVVGGDTTLNGNLAVATGLTVSQKLVSLADASLNANLVVGGETTFNGNLAVTKGITVSQKLVSLADASLNANLAVGGDMLVSKGLTLGQKLVTIGDASLNSGLSVGSDSSFNGNLRVIGKNFNFVEGFASGNLTVSEAIFANSLVATNLQVTGTTVTVNTTNLAVNDNIITLNKGASNIPVGGSGIEVETTGGSAIAGSFALVGTSGSEKWSIKNVGDTGFSAVAIASDLSRTDASVNVALTRLTQQSYTTGLTTIAGNVTLADANSKLLVVGDASLNARLSAAGDVSFAGKLAVVGTTSLGVLSAGATTLSTVSASTLLLSSDASLNAKLSAAGDVSFAGKLAVVGNTTLANVIASDVSLNGKLRVSSDVSFGGNVQFSQLPRTTITNFTGVDGNVFVTKNYVDSASGVTLAGDNAFSGNVSFTRDVSMGANLNVAGNINANLVATNKYDLNKSFDYLWTAGVPTNLQNYYVAPSLLNSSLNMLSAKMSLDGRYITAVGNANGAFARVSSDYGVTWATPSFGATPPSAITEVAMSGNGQYQYIGSEKNVTNVQINLYKSTNYGLTWNTTTVGGTAFAVSETGQYVLACSSVANGLSLSTNYGDSFISLNSNTSKGLDTQPYVEVAMSASGKIQVALAYFPSTGYNIYISTNYGANWALNTTSPQNIGGWGSKIAMSSSGQYIGITCSVGFILSSDYGANWSIPLNNTVVSPAYETKTIKVSMSSSGQYIAIVIPVTQKLYYSNDYGVTWANRTDTGISNGTGVALSSNGSYFVIPYASSGIVSYKSVPSIVTERFNYDISINGNVQFSKLPRTTITDFTSADGNVFVTKNYVAGLTSSGASTSADNQFTGRNTFTQDLSLNANLFIGRDISLVGRLNMIGDASLNGNLRVGRTFAVNGNTTLANVVASTLLLSSDASLNAKLSAAGDVSFSGKLAVVGATTLGTASASTLLLSSDASLNAKLSAAGDVSFGGKLAVVGATTLGAASASTLLLSSDASLNARLSAAGDVSFAGKLEVVGATTLGTASASTLLLSSDASLNARLSAAGDVSFGGKLAVVGNTTLGNMSASALVVSGNANVNNTLFVGNISSTNISVLGNLTVLGTTTTISATNLDICDNIIRLNKSGTLATVGSSGIEIESAGSVTGNILLKSDNKWYINSSLGELSITDNLPKLTQQSYTSGTTTTAIVGNVTLADVNSKLLVVGDASLNAKLSAAGDVSFAGKLAVVGATTLGTASASTLLLSSDASLNARLSAAGDVSFAGKLAVVGATTLGTASASTLLLTSDASLNAKLSAAGDVSFGGKLAVVGATTLGTASASTLLLSSDASLNAKLSAAGDVSFAGKLAVVGATTLGAVSASTLLLSSDASLNAKLSVGSDVSLNGNVQFSRLPITNVTSFAGVNGNSFVTKNYVDGSAAIVNANNVLTGLNTYTQDVSFNMDLFVGMDISLAGRLNMIGDASMNGNLRVGRDVSFNGRMNLTGDASFNGSLVTIGGNVQLGTGVRGVAINKAPGSTYALDVSGQSFLAGNVFLYKHPNDGSTTTNPFVDMSNVNLNLFGVAEKFTFPAYTAGTTSLTLDCATSTIFDISGVNTAAITSISFTNVPATVGRSVSITVLLHQATANKAYYFSGTTVTVNGYTGITFSYPDGTTPVTAPTNNCTLFVHQFVILWRAAATAPKVIMYTSSIV